MTISLLAAIPAWVFYSSPPDTSRLISPFRLEKSQDRVVSLPLVPIPVRTESIRQPKVKAVLLPWSCQEIRNYAGTHSRKELRAKAREYRLTKTQIAAAKACIEEARK